MYLSELKLWNFRKFGSETNELNLEKPDLEISFNNGLNVLIGENDSGKTVIIDAIKLVLKTHSVEWIKLEDEDFYKDTKRLRIECIFRELSDNEAKNFTEWLGMEDEGIKAKPYLRIILDVNKTDDKILPYDIKAGIDDEGYALPAGAKEYLKTTYMKPLRDAKTELIPRKNSRLSKILMGHPVFIGKEKDHELLNSFNELRGTFKKYFTDDKKNGCKIKKTLEEYLGKFFGEKQNVNFLTNEQKILNILEKLGLTLEDEKLGLGSHNLLFIAAELLNLERDNWDGLRLGLIEELEAHLHPQAQLRIIEFLQNRIKEKKVQMILTTHSPNLGSKVNLENLIICHEKKVFPMGNTYTKLEETDYTFLQRFLDTTKANLFFAKGVILVEGWAEEFIIPALAKIIGIDLIAKGVSVVNIGNTAFLRYARIFQRKDEQGMNIPVSVITDLDIKPDEFKKIDKDAITEKENKYNGQKVKTFVSSHWTLEYCIARSEKFRKFLYKAVLEALKEQKINEGIKDLTKYDIAISDIETCFDSWKAKTEDIASDIYLQILGEQKISDLCKTKISKAIIAQHFAEILKQEFGEKKLEEDELKKIEEEGMITYMTQAIKYATGENVSYL